MTGADALVAHVAALRRDQAMEEAFSVVADATRRFPDDPRVAFAFAQISFETWRPAAELFAVARRLNGDHPDLIRNHALALAAEDETAIAIALLDETLGAHPLWLDGHRALASLKATSGASDRADDSYARACKAEPANAALRMAWFQHHATRRDWTSARRVLDETRAAGAGGRALEMAAIFLDCETGARGLEPRFAELGNAGDPGFDICAVRYFLRVGDAQRAEAIAARYEETPQARLFWPYRGLCWRLADDPRAQWLDGAPLHARVFDLGAAAGDLGVLAATLRRLHRMKAPYPEQSVRGGTQTDRHLFLNPDPSIQTARRAIEASVRRYIDALPPPDARHPLLGPSRGGIRFEGSWSVRLAGGGHHASHTHVMGWISSAFYVALPTDHDAGATPAGQLSLGAPPPELGLPLAPYRRIAPAPARLVLFPSTLWHATEPFPAGERLTIAFDVGACGQGSSQ